MAKRKVGRPRRKKPMTKISLNIDNDIFRSLQRRSSETGETVTSIIQSSLRKDIYEYEMQYVEKKPYTHREYSNPLAQEIYNKLIQFLPKELSLTVLEIACRKIDMTPETIKKRHITHSFMNNLCTAMKNLYVGDSEKLDKCRNELLEMIRKA